ncbi:fatty-acid amide hydrolase 2-like [Bacillus rossius redtenbacheri]|uniref:fatty-acid amide hydrolase 2-like n=1 Tax=Bacillus rossius redtenbacheri TaxID=93214 RepID=UPI002FDF05F1
MEVALRLFGAVQLLLYWLTLPVYWLWRRWYPGTRAPPPTDPMLLLSASRLAEGIRSQQLSSEQVVRAYVSRLREVDAVVHAVTDHRFQEALAEARAVDQLVASGASTQEELRRDSPLLGVPFTVKESCSLQGMSFAVGSLPRAGVKAAADGVAVSCVRRAGGIPLCVTNTPELCLSFETDNLVSGRTLNPYDTLRTPGGSSGGEAALVGGGASVVGVGSDIAGSIRLPAMFCGVFGHKPTPGFVSTEGHLPHSPDPNFKTFLTVGPITRYAEDLRPMLRAMAGDSAPQLRLDEPVDLGKMRLFFMEDAGFSLVGVPVQKEIRASLRKAVECLRTKYGMSVQTHKFKELEESVEIGCSTLFSLKGIPQLLSDDDNPKKSRNLAVEFFKSLCGFSTISLQALCFYLLMKVNSYTSSSRAAKYQADGVALRKKFTEMLGGDAVMLYPTSPVPACHHLQVFVRSAAVLYVVLFNALGLPATHVPTGLDSRRLPVGLQVIAGPGQDRLCLAVAEALEREFGGWVPPS